MRLMYLRRELTCIYERCKHAFLDGNVRALAHLGGVGVDAFTVRHPCRRETGDWSAHECSSTRLQVRSVIRICFVAAK
jgi:hypothetical protein